MSADSERQRHARFGFTAAVNKRSAHERRANKRRERQMRQRTSAKLATWRAGDGFVYGGRVCVLLAKNPDGSVSWTDSSCEHFTMSQEGLFGCERVQ